MAIFYHVAILLQRRGALGYYAPTMPTVKRTRKIMPQLGPHSRAIDRGSLGLLDGRSREGRFLRMYDAMLTKHLGGKPSRVQREMIRRCARLALHLELADEKALIRGEDMSAWAARSYVTWHRALMSALRQLGVDELLPPPPAVPSLREILAEQARSQ